LLGKLTERRKFGVIARAIGQAVATQLMRLSGTPARFFIIGPIWFQRSTHVSGSFPGCEASQCNLCAFSPPARAERKSFALA
jgi:hypothetical protein